jgi:hypothetical protein
MCLSDRVEIAGPDRVRLSALVERYLRSTGDARQVVADPHALYFGAELNDRSLVPGEGARIGRIRFENWLGQQLKQNAARQVA